MTHSVARYLRDLDVPETIVSDGVGCVQLEGQNHLKEKYSDIVRNLEKCHLMQWAAFYVCQSIPSFLYEKVLPVTKRDVAQEMEVK